MNPLANHVRHIFESTFASEPTIIRAPGRINLIGEHTDYNGGLVLPAAIDKATFVAISPSQNDIGTWVSVDMKEQLEVNFSEIIPSQTHTWANYIKGVIEQFKMLGKKVNAFDCVVAGDIPIGSGLSSSASLESAIAFAINHLQTYNLNSEELARLVQRAENTFIGVQCGIMDMYASIHGKAEQAMRLNCESLQCTYYPLNLGNYSIVLFNSGVKHTLVETAYNLRRQQCQEGLAYFRAHFDADIPNLSQVPMEFLEKSESELDPLIYKRCKYVIEENARILGACEDLTAGDLAGFGLKMRETHRGLQNLYEVSCPELDFLVKMCDREESVLGSRLMGGGFGGYTINLIKSDQIEAIYNKLADLYLKTTNIALEMYIVKTADGVGIYT